MKRWYGFAFSIVILTSCMQKDYGPVSNRPVGITTGYPSVVEIYGRRHCTGTVVGPRAILTAAHCVAATKSFRVSSGKVTATGTMVFPIGAPESSEDLALLVTEEDLALTPYAIGNQISEDNWVTLVGYGCNDFETQMGAGVKRVGTNVVTEIGQFIQVETPWWTGRHRTGLLGPSNRAGSCYGDSGGPLPFSQGDRERIVGVLHSVLKGNDDHITTFVDLTRPDIRAKLMRFNRERRLQISFQ